MIVCTSFFRETGGTVGETHGADLERVRRQAVEFVQQKIEIVERLRLGRWP